MNNELYRKTIVPSAEAPDGDTPTVLHVTQENNGYAVFLTGYDVAGAKLLHWNSDRDTAIEYGVTEAENMLIERVS